MYPVADVLALGFSHYIIIIFSIIGIAWGTFMAKKVSSVQMIEDKIRVNDNAKEKEEDTGHVFPWTNAECYN